MASDRTGYQSEVAAALDAVDAKPMYVAFDVTKAAAHPLIARHDDTVIESLAEYLPAPLRLKQLVLVQDPDSFVAYVKKFADKDNAFVFVDRADAKFRAALDYHRSPTEPTWNEHTVVLALTATPEWTAWTGVNKMQKNQTDFAMFLEDHLPEVVSPDGASLLELVLNFEAKKAVAFSSSIRLADGTAQLMFTEDVQGNQKGSEIKVPTTFTLRMSPYYGSAPVTLTARLRYRIASGALALWFDILRLEEERQKVIDAITADLRDRLEDDVHAILVGKA